MLTPLSVMLGIGAAHLTNMAVEDLAVVETKMFPLAYFLVLIGYFLILSIDVLRPQTVTHHCDVTGGPAAAAGARRGD